MDALVGLDQMGGAPVVTLTAPVRPPVERARAVLDWSSAVASARRSLDEAGAAAIADAMLAPAEALGQDWPRRAGGVVWVAGPAGSRSFATIDAPPLSHNVGSVPALARLVRLARTEPFLLLGLGLHDTRLYEVRLAPTVMDVPGLPTRLEDAVIARERGQHLSRHEGHRAGGGMVATTHGQVDPGREHEHELDEFCRFVAGRVFDAIGPNDHRPLVVAGVADLTARFAHVAHAAGRIAATVDGSTERVPTVELGRRAAQALEQGRAGRLGAEIERFHSRVGTGLASTDLDEVMTAGAQGRIDTLYVVDDDGGTVTDDERLDRAVAGALGHRSRVVVVPSALLDAPGASFRY